MSDRLRKGLYGSSMVRGGKDSKEEFKVDTKRAYREHYRGNMEE